MSSSDTGNSFDLSQMEALRILRERIVVFAASRIGREKAEDVAQETLLLMTQKYSDVREREDLMRLAIGVAKNMIRKVRRGDARYSELVEDGHPVADQRADFAAELEREQIVTRLLAAVRELGQRCRDVLRLRIEGRTSEDLMRLLGAGSIDTVYTWEHRCRKSLMKTLGGRFGVAR
jgi:RNA polymerase sigma-70 factor, ECF subfamily